MADDKSILSKYFPEAAVESILFTLKDKNIILRISKARRTKLGDYRPALQGKPHRISLNHDLNRYEMLITFIHELAHLYAFEQFGRHHQPHGTAWKNLFGKLMLPFIESNLFPEDIRNELHEYLYKSKAANGSDLKLRRVLKAYNPLGDGSLIVENLPAFSHFRIPDGRVFQKQEQRRKRFKCLCMNDKRYYLFSPLAVVEPIDGKDSNQSLYLTKKSLD